MPQLPFSSSRLFPPCEDFPLLAGYRDRLRGVGEEGVEAEGRDLEGEDAVDERLLELSSSTFRDALPLSLPSDEDSDSWRCRPYGRRMTGAGGTVASWDEGLSGVEEEGTGRSKKLWLWGQGAAM